LTRSSTLTLPVIRWVLHLRLVGHAVGLIWRPASKPGWQTFVAAAHD
jgi:hypothetical protein